MRDLFETANQVTTEAEFIEFLRLLGLDREEELRQESLVPSNPWGPGATGWENGTIEAFLESSSAWGKVSMDGMSHYEKPENPWTRCAQIIYMGKIYE